MTKKQLINKITKVIEDTVRVDIGGTPDFPGDKYPCTVYCRLKNAKKVAEKVVSTLTPKEDPLDKPKKKLKKEYFLSVVEEGVLNPDYKGCSGGRIEIYQKGREYAIDEVRFLIPDKFMPKFRELFDFKEITELFRIDEINLGKYDKDKKETNPIPKR